LLFVFCITKTVPKADWIRLLTANIDITFVLTIFIPLAFPCQTA